MIRNRVHERGLTATELALALLLVVLLAGASAPMVGSTLRTYRRDSAARHVMAKIRGVQSLAVTSNGVFGFQWGGDPMANQPLAQYRIIRDTTGSCGFPAVSAPEDGTNVIRSWFDLTDEFPGVTIQSVEDSTNKPIGGVMFNYIGASTNTCTTVSFPVLVTISDNWGMTRTIEIASTGKTKIL